MSTSKSTACYKDIFEFIEQQFELKPKSFISDFETGLRKALRQCYPHTTINGCWFHYVKCIRKKINRLGLSKLWIKKARDNEPETAIQAKRIYKMICKLPLLPKEQFLVGYKHVRSMAKGFKLINKFAKFFEYYGRTWLAEVCLKNVFFSKNLSELFFVFFSIEREKSTLGRRTFNENDKFCRVNACHIWTEFSKETKHL